MRFSWFTGDLDKLCRKYCVTPDVESARRFIVQNPDILKTECDDRLRRIAQRLPDEDERQLVMGRRMLLEHCRRDGVEAACAAWSRTEDESAVVLHGLIQLRDVEHVAAYIRNNPVLFDYPTRMALTGLIAAHPDKSSELMAVYVKLLDRARDIGFDAAFTELKAGFWTDPLAPFVADLYWDPKSDEIVRCAAHITIAGVKAAVAANAAVALDPRVGVALLRFMLVSRTWDERVRVGMLRAELARSRRLGAERALVDDWKIDTRFSEHQEFFRSIQPALARLRNFEDLHRLRRAHPDWLDKIVAYDEQHEYLNTPTPTNVSGSFAWESMVLQRFDGGDDAALTADVGRALIARAPEVPPYLLATTTFVVARANEHRADALEGAAAFAAVAASVQRLYQSAYDLFPSQLVLDRAAIRSQMATHLMMLARVSAGGTEAISKARAYLEEAESLAADDKGQFLAGIRNALGRLWLDEMDSPDAAERAIAYLEGAQALVSGPGGALWERKVVFALGRAHLQRGDLNRALAAFSRRMEIAYEMRQANPFPSGHRKDAIEAAEAFQFAALCHVRLGRVTEAAEVLEKGRAQSVAEVLEARHLRDVAGTASSGELAAIIEEYIASTRSAPFAALDHKPVDTALEFGRVIEEARQKHVDRFRSAAAKSDGANQLIDIRDLLPVGHSAISISVTRLGLLVVIASRGRQHTAFEYPQLDSKILMEQLFRRGKAPETFEGWMVDVIERSGTSIAAMRTTMDDCLAQLTPLLLQIIDELPDDTHSLCFVLDGRMSHLPLHAVLLDQQSGERVVDRYTVSHAPSFAVLGYLLKRTPARVDRFLGYANPGKDDELVYTSLETGLAASCFEDAALVDEHTAKPALLEQLASRTVIHFACHASYDPLEPDHAALDLGDDQLDLGDIERSGFDLAGCRLVTLSACHTGALAMTNVGQEQVGLPAAFVVAGAQCVLASLWAVPDLTGAMLMSDFYRRLTAEGASPPVALREAQLWLRDAHASDVWAFAQRCAGLVTSKADSKRIAAEVDKWRRVSAADPKTQPFEHPYFWAGFAAVGT